MVNVALGYICLIHICLRMNCVQYFVHCVSTMSARRQIPALLLYTMIKAILIEVHRPTQDNTEVIFPRPLCGVGVETSKTKQPFPNSVKSVSVSCSSQSCKVIIHHCALTLGHKQQITDLLRGYRVSNCTEPWTTFNTWFDSAAANMDEQKYGSRWDLNMDVITALIEI